MAVAKDVLANLRSKIDEIPPDLQDAARRLINNRRDLLASVLGLVEQSGVSADHVEKLLSSHVPLPTAPAAGSTNILHEAEAHEYEVSLRKNWAEVKRKRETIVFTGSQANVRAIDFLKSEKLQGDVEAPYVSLLDDPKFDVDCVFSAGKLSKVQPAPEGTPFPKMGSALTRFVRGPTVVRLDHGCGKCKDFYTGYSQNPDNFELLRDLLFEAGDDGIAIGVGPTALANFLRLDPPPTAYLAVTPEMDRQLQTLSDSETPFFLVDGIHHGMPIVTNNRAYKPSKKDKTPLQTHLALVRQKALQYTTAVGGATPTAAQIRALGYYGLEPLCLCFERKASKQATAELKLTGDAREDTLAALSTGPLTLRKVCDATKLSPSAAKEALKRLVDEKIIVTNGSPATYCKKESAGQHPTSGSGSGTRPPPSKKNHGGGKEKKPTKAKQDPPGQRPASPPAVAEEETAVVSEVVMPLLTMKRGLSDQVFLERAGYGAFFVEVSDYLASFSRNKPITRFVTEFVRENRTGFPMAVGELILGVKSSLLDTAPSERCAFLSALVGLQRMKGQFPVRGEMVHNGA